MAVTGKGTYIKNVLLPGFLISGLTGAIVGVLIFFYKWGAEYIGSVTSWIYVTVRENPLFVPVVFIGLVGLALVMSVLIKGAPSVGGGGIPTAEGILRGLITFRWLRSLFCMIVNSYIGFFAGLPLGNEGPSVLIGTSIGRGTNKLINRTPAWDRYVMTGGAAAGFAVATGAPVTGIIFALEEVHKRFSPMILMVAMSSVVFAEGVAQALAYATGRSTEMFAIALLPAMPLQYIWIGLLAGIAAGLAALLFIKGFSLMYKLLSERLTKISLEFKLIALFVLVGAVGLILPAAVGSGHGVIETLFDRGYVWYTVLALFLVKIVMIILSGGAGATGGLFIPILTVGALTGGLIAETLIAMGFSESWYAVIVTVTVAAFLGGTLRAPITALVFFIEALGGMNNVLFAAIGVLAAFVLLETVGAKPLYDIVLEHKLKVAYEGRQPQIVELNVTVQPNAFVVGKTTRDVFWPPSCLVLGVVHAGQSAKNTRMDKDGDKVLRAGDSLKLRVQTYDENETKQLIYDLVGKE